MRATCWIKLVLALSLASACSDTRESEVQEAAALATVLLVEGQDGACATFAEPQSAFEVFSAALAAGEADVVGIANAKFVEECSGAGGTHVFTSATAEGKRFWLGSHSCWLEQPAGLESGVIVGIGLQTAALFQGEAGWCMNYPGEDRVFATDIRTSAMAWFANDADAARFLEAL